MAMSKRSSARLLLAVCLSGSCGLMPERVARSDPRLKPMFDAIARVDRNSLGFTDIPEKADMRVEWHPRAGYDAMLHIHTKTSRTIAFKRTLDGFEWIGEQEIFLGPREYDSVDGRYQESITITYERAPVSGSPLNTVAVSYLGEDPELAWPRELSLTIVRPWLTKWGYR
jgi:hypothetical protein